MLHYRPLEKNSEVVLLLLIPA